MIRLKLTKIEPYAQSAINMTNDYNVIDLIPKAAKAQNTVSRLPDGTRYDHLANTSTAPETLEVFKVTIRVGRANSNALSIESSVINLYNALGKYCDLTAELLQNGDKYICTARLIGVADRLTRGGYSKRHLIELSFQPIDGWEFTV